MVTSNPTANNSVQSNSLTGQIAAGQSVSGQPVMSIVTVKLWQQKICCQAVIEQWVIPTLCMHSRESLYFLTGHHMSLSKLLLPTEGCGPPFNKRKTNNVTHFTNNCSQTALDDGSTMLLWNSWEQLASSAHENIKNSYHIPYYKATKISWYTVKCKKYIQQDNKIAISFVKCTHITAW